MFPVKGIWIDAETLLPDSTDYIQLPNLQHSAEVTIVAFFKGTVDDTTKVETAATGSTTVTLSDESGTNTHTIVLDAADQRNGKVIKIRSGYELGEITKAKHTQSLGQGTTVQVSIF